jgi:hypothetical protein
VFETTFSAHPTPSLIIEKDSRRCLFERHQLPELHWAPAPNFKGFLRCFTWGLPTLAGSVAVGNRLKAWDSGTGGNAPRRLSGQALEKGPEQRGKPEGLPRFRWREDNVSQPYRLAVYLFRPILGAMPQVMELEPFRPGPTDDGRCVAVGNRLKAWDSGTGGNAPRRLSGQAPEKGQQQRGKPEGLPQFRWREENVSQPYRLAVYLFRPILGAMPQAMEWEPFRPGPTDDGRFRGGRKQAESLGFRNWGQRPTTFVGTGPRERRRTTREA